MRSNLFFYVHQLCTMRFMPPLSKKCPCPVLYGTDMNQSPYAQLKCREHSDCNICPQAHLWRVPNHSASAAAYCWSAAAGELRVNFQVLYILSLQFATNNGYYMNVRDHHKYLDLKD